MLDDDGFDLFRHVADGGNQVGAEVWCQHAPIHRDKILARGPAHCLHHGSLDLPLDLLRIDRLADIIGADDVQNVQLAGFAVYLYLDCLGDKAVGKVGDAITGLGIKGGSLGG